MGISLKDVGKALGGGIIGAIGPKKIIGALKGKKKSGGGGKDDKGKNEGGLVIKARGGGAATQGLNFRVSR